MARKTGELKKRCWLAKQRLKLGYWESLKNESRQDINCGADDRGDRAHIDEYARFISHQSGGFARPQVSAADEKMYKKVCDILDGDEVALNPIGQLIERDVYDALDSDSKQRYILELSEKFRELKDRYYRERTGS